MRVKLVTTRLKRPCETRGGPTEVHGGTYPGTGFNARFEIGSTSYAGLKRHVREAGQLATPPVHQRSQYAGTKEQYQPVTARLERIGNARRAGRDALEDLPATTQLLTGNIASHRKKILVTKPKFTTLDLCVQLSNEDSRKFGV